MSDRPSREERDALRERLRVERERQLPPVCEGTHPAGPVGGPPLCPRCLRPDIRVREDGLLEEHRVDPSVPSTRQRVEEALADQYARQVERVAADLEEAARRVRREGQPRPTSPSDPRPDYPLAARSVVHVLRAHDGNSVMYMVLKAATEADRYLRSEEDRCTDR